MGKIITKGACDITVNFHIEHNSKNFTKKAEIMYLTYTVDALVGAGGGYVRAVVREELVVFVDPPLKLTLPVLVPRLPFIYRGHCRNDVC